jgi:thiamine biosynthesis lipoprotein
VAHVPLAEGGLATSSVSARRWTRAGRRWTQLLDPRTLGPVEGPWRTVSATGATCVAANVATTAAVVLGADAPGWLESHDVDALLVAHDGTTRRTGGWPGAGRAELPDHVGDHLIGGGAP